MKTVLATGIAFTALMGVTHPSVAQDKGAFQSYDERQQRWQGLQKEIFGDHKLEAGDKMISLDAPARAQDAALVPISVTLADPDKVKALYVVIDDNPSPVAAHFTFGPQIDPKMIKLRVRVNTYTNMHAVAEMKDGRLLETVKFVKASGGCSAPMGVSDEEAMRGMGEMRLKLAGEVSENKPVEATLMVRHPNFNGMQMNQETRDYTPARYIQNIDVKYQDKQVFQLSTDISLATNPVISFDLVPDTAKGTLKVAVDDSQQGHWEKSFNVPNVSN